MPPARDAQWVYSKAFVPCRPVGFFSGLSAGLPRANWGRHLALALCGGGQHQVLQVLRIGELGDMIWTPRSLKAPANLDPLLTRAPDRHDREDRGSAGGFLTPHCPHACSSNRTPVLSERGGNGERGPEAEWRFPSDKNRKRTLTRTSQMAPFDSNPTFVTARRASAVPPFTALADWVARRPCRATADIDGVPYGTRKRAPREQGPCRPNPRFSLRFSGSSPFWSGPRWWPRPARTRKRGGWCVKTKTLCPRCKRLAAIPLATGRPRASNRADNSQRLFRAAKGRRRRQSRPRRAILLEDLGLADSRIAPSSRDPNLAGCPIRCSRAGFTVAEEDGPARRKKRGLGPRCETVATWAN